MKGPGNSNPETPPDRRAVVAVIRRGESFLVIKRSQQVIAPGAFCFPGGGLEGSETCEMAIRRELREEIGVECRPIREVWRGRTPWNVDLAWWLVELSEGAELTANEAEVASTHWVTLEEMLTLEPLLESNRDFYAAWRRGEVEL